jgi:hypothetical protein
LVLEKNDQKFSRLFVQRNGLPIFIEAIFVARHVPKRSIRVFQCGKSPESFRIGARHIMVPSDYFSHPVATQYCQLYYTFGIRCSQGQEIQRPFRKRH